MKEAIDWYHHSRVVLKVEANILRKSISEDRIHIYELWLYEPQTIYFPLKSSNTLAE